MPMAVLVHCAEAIAAPPRPTCSAMNSATTATLASVMRLMRLKCVAGWLPSVKVGRCGCASGGVSISCQGTASSFRPNLLR